MDKVIYWKNRKAGKRGQTEATKSKFYPKGEKVFDIKNGKKREILNAEGSHMVQFGKIPKKVSRVEARSYAKAPAHSATKKNYQYQAEKNGFKHIINEHLHVNPFPPFLTNHLRHRQRQIQRLQKAGQVS